MTNRKDPLSEGLFFFLSRYCSAGIKKMCSVDHEVSFKNQILLLNFR